MAPFIALVLKSESMVHRIASHRTGTLIH